MCIMGEAKAHNGTDDLEMPKVNNYEAWKWIHDMDVYDTIRRYNNFKIEKTS